MVNVIKKSHLRSRTHFDTLGPASGRMTSTLTPQNRLVIDSESEDGSSTQDDDRLGVDNGQPRGKSPSPSLQDIFTPQQNVKLSLSWED
ncbi:hypothetical protein AAF712_014512 [Marasmius tenuissimus]|uniref:Uncharacterized protein n=1 Tax=Marasmius tenuissimus TaxID=585030 RepID=A0ABR2ZBZ1_9AGAR